MAVDYGSIMQAGQNLVPDVLGQLTKENALRAQTASLQAEAAVNQQKVTRAQQFQQDIHSFDGSPTSVSHLIMKYPEFADHLKQGWDVQDKAKTDADLLNMGEIYSAASGGNWKLAKQLAHTRADAEKAAGFSDPAYEATLGVMDKAADGDPTQQKVVLNMLGMGIAAKTGPEHFATVYGGLNAADKGFTLDAGATRYDANGRVVVQSPYVKTADGGILERDGTGGGDPASPGAQTTAPGFDGAVEHVLSNEGGYNPSDMNGAPVNFGINQKANPGVDVKNLTRDQAKQIYHDKYWVPSGAENLPANLQAPYFDVYIRNPAFAKKALADSGGDPAKFMAASSAYFQNLAKKPSGQPYAEAWANRDAKNTAIATGGGSSAESPTAEGAPPGYHWLTRGSTPDQYRNLTPAEATQRGLDPSQQYQLNTKTGQLSGLGKVDPGDQPLPGDPSKEGQAYLDSLPPGAKALGQQAKLLTEGRLGTISSFALSKPYWQKVLQLATQYDHTFDMNMAPTRKAALTAFTGTGKGAMLVGSINRVANHMDLLWNESKKLAGPNTGFGPLDTALAAGGQAFERPDAKAYDTEVTFVAGELGKLAKAGVVTEGEVDKIIGNLSRKNATKTRESAIQAAVGIISGAVDPLKDQYNSAFVEGSPRPTIPWVTPKAQEIFKRIGGVDLSLTGAGADSNAPAASSSRQPPPGATKTATGPNGQKAALVNGHWVVY